MSFNKHLKEKNDNYSLFWENQTHLGFSNFKYIPKIFYSNERNIKKMSSFNHSI